MMKVSIVDEMKIKIAKDRFKTDSIKNFKNDQPDIIEKPEEVLLIYVEEKYLEILKAELLDNTWKYINIKLAYPYEYLKSFDDYPKPVNDLKKEDFLSK